MHTKGNWEISSYRQREIWVGADYPIATCHRGSKSQEEVQANAKLIAAAPALLDACKLTKKRLLTHGVWDDGCFYYAGCSAPELEEPLEKLTDAIEQAETKE